MNVNTCNFNYFHLSYKKLYAGDNMIYIDKSLTS